MIQKSKFNQTLIDTIQLVLGIAASAFSMACFALPYDMVVAGVTGIGRIFNHAFGLNITLVVTVVNVGVFVAGLITIGKKFAGTIVVGTFLFPFFLEVFQRAEYLHHLVDDPLLAAICAGILDGVGLGLVIRMGGSTGGIDVPPIILHHKLGWKIAPVMYTIDFAIFVCQLPITSSNGVILGIIYALIYSVVMNKILVMNQGGVQVMIHSAKWEEINERILQYGCGTTLLYAEGGYHHEHRPVISCVLGNRTLNYVKKKTLEIDPDAFLTISSVSEVNGNGFTKLFDDGDYLPRTERED